MLVVKQALQKALTNPTLFGTRAKPPLFGKCLREIRKSKGVTQEQLGEGIYVDHGVVSNWENNISLPSEGATHVDKIADKLKCTDDERTRLHRAFVMTLLKNVGYPVE